MAIAAWFFMLAAFFGHDTTDRALSMGAAVVCALLSISYEVSRLRKPPVRALPRRSGAVTGHSEPDAP